MLMQGFLAKGPKINLSFGYPKPLVYIVSVSMKNSSYFLAASSIANPQKDERIDIKWNKNELAMPESAEELIVPWPTLAAID
jgi:hypothetical protein